MRQFFGEIDCLLRGEYTQPEDLAQGEIRIRSGSLAMAGVVLGSVYGVFMGLYGVARTENASVLQLLASTAKVPLLFLLTLLVTFPSLYVFSALADCKLRFDQTGRLLLATIAVNLAVVASFGPVTGFFTLSTTSYPFMVVLNVLVFGISGISGLLFLRRALDKVFSAPPSAGDAASREVAPASTPDDGESGRPPVDLAASTPEAPTLVPPPSTRRPATRVFRLWAVTFGIVGAQMGWVLRPFIGDPAQPFTLFRERDANFFSAVLEALRQIFS